MIFIIAWRNIWRNKSRSGVLIASIITGICAGIILTGIMMGMYGQRQDDAIRNEVSNFQIHTKEFKTDNDPRFEIQNSESVLNIISEYKEVRALSGRVIAHGMILTAGSSAGVKINGVVPQDEANTRGLNAKITEGSYLERDKHNQILVGEKLAHKMQMKIKSRVVLTFEDIHDNVISASFRVCGFFKTTNPSFDETVVYVSKKNLAELLQTKNEVHEIAVLLKNKEDAESVISRTKKQFPDLLVEDWREIAPEIGLMIDMGAGISKVVIVLILFALAFGIINTMLMAMLERTYEIGMMIALGMNKAKLFMLVVLETVMLVMAGTPFGVLFSYLAVSFFYKHGIDLGQYSKGLESFGMSHIIHPQVSLSQYMQILFLVFITALISSLFPARKALKVDPAESIKK
ncbi:MAG: ABC transporter permease [Bacteroidetes bacterium]|nr:ABC transporter permease [Bacteroidota bacterium]